MIGGFFLGLLLAYMQSFGQAQVTGHISAVIVEGISLSSHTNNSIQIKQNAPSARMDLGEICVSGGASATCAVLISTSTLEAENGNHIDFETDTYSEKRSPTLNHQGQHVFKLQGSAGNEIFSNKEKAYSAQYNVVFAYN